MSGLRLRFPSLAALGREALATFVRFPATLLSGMVAAELTISLVDDSAPPEKTIHLAMVAALGIPLFTVLRLYAEKPMGGRPLRRSWPLMLGGVVLLVVYWRLLGRVPGDSRYIQYFQFSLAAHLAVAFAPFLGRGEINGFWQFNRRLFLRIVLSGIYASVFFGGLSLALLAIDNLFDVKVNEYVYPRLWLFTVFVFQTWHFLGGVPKGLADLEADRDRPRALRIFGQYLLVPLVVLYLLILYGYMAKILLSRQWPHGWVGWLVSGVSIFGVLTLLLLDPGREEAETRWIRRFARAFYVAILPLLALLFVALAKRVGQYGVTERRYFLFVLGLWLFGVSLYMLFSASKSIKIVPTTLCLLALVTALGPWGAYQISLRSQIRRLEGLLGKSGHLAHGKIARSDRPVPEEDLREIGAAVHYLIEHHGPGQLNRLSERDWRGGSDESTYAGTLRVAREFLETAGLEYAGEGGGEYGPTFYYERQFGPLDISGYDSLVPFSFLLPGESYADEGQFGVRLRNEGRDIDVMKEKTVLLSGSLEEMTRQLGRHSPAQQAHVPDRDMTLVLEGPSLRARVSFSTLHIRRREGKAPSLVGGTGFVLIDQTP
jgi:hypothetical protein